MRKENAATAQGRTSNRLIGIDLLKAFSCLAILAWHVFANGGFNFSGIAAAKVIPSWDHLVYLFMILSGFGISNGYHKRFMQKEISLDYFYIRRYQRILPYFSILILLNILADLSINSIMQGIIEISLVFGFLPNNMLDVVGVAWTLGIIFVFYITYPFFVFLTADKKRAWLSLLCSVLIQSMCQIYFMTEIFVVKDYVPRHSFLYCAPFFLAGCIIFLYKDKITQVIGNKKPLVLGLCLALTVLYYLLPQKTGKFSILELKLLLLYALWAVFSLTIQRIPKIEWLINYISSISMEIYLSHMLCFRVLEKTGVLHLFGKGFRSYVIDVVLTMIAVLIFIPIIQLLIALAGRILAKINLRNRNITF